jgi:hypothetical protein
MIRFKVSTRFAKSQDFIIIRVGEIVTATPLWTSLPSVKPGTTDVWQLDCGNDWSLRKISDTEYQLQYRYSTSQDEQALLGLRAFLEWTFKD